MKVDLNKLEALAIASVNESPDWSRYKRDFDYVSFGPVDSHKDNNEGPNATYRLIAALTPETVLELIRQARRSR